MCGLRKNRGSTHQATAGCQEPAQGRYRSRVEDVKTLDPIMVTAPLIRSEVPLVDPVNELTGDDLRVQVQGNLARRFSSSSA